MTFARRELVTLANLISSAPKLPGSPGLDDRKVCGTHLRCHGSIAHRMDEEEKVDRVPPSDIEIIEVEDFVPLDLIIPVLRQDGNRCECGLWQF